MKANELMIGDLVYYSYPNQFVTKVIDVCSHREESFIRCQRDPKDKLYVPGKFEDFHVDILSSVPLTSEILEKNGFEFLDTSNNKIKSVWTGWWVLDGLKLGCFCNLKFPVYFNISGVNVKVNYVHELQHILKLYGIEKEIVL